MGAVLSGMAIVSIAVSCRFYEGYTSAHTPPRTYDEPLKALELNLIWHRKHMVLLLSCVFYLVFFYIFYVFIRFSFVFHWCNSFWLFRLFECVNITVLLSHCQRFSRRARAQHNNAVLQCPEFDLTRMTGKQDDIRFEEIPLKFEIFIATLRRMEIRQKVSQKPIQSTINQSTLLPFARFNDTPTAAILQGILTVI